MVHMVSGAGAGAAPHEYYAGEYYADAPFYLPQPPPLAAADPHAPPHLCALHSDYGGVALGGASGVPLLGHVVQPVMDESGAVRHVLVPHPQPAHHYGPANGGNGPQQYYGPPTGYPPPHFHVHGGPPPPPPHHLQHSPPPPNPVYHKDERTHKQYIKLKKKLEQKQTTRNSNNGLAELNSGSSTPSLSPRKELNGWQRTATAGTSSEGEGSSAATSVQGDDDDTQNLLDMLSAARTPQVSEITSSSALVQWNTPIPPGLTLPPYDLTYELLLGDKGRYKAIYSGPSLSCRVRDLQPGTEYSVCLQVRAGDLTGAASGAATFRAPACEPGAPPAPRASQRTRNSLLLRWSAAADHGARLIHYVLECDSGDGQFVEIARPRTRQHTAQGLRSAARYRFRLAAVNERGRGPWSEEAMLWTCGAPPPVPAPPSLVRATAHELLLSWPRRVSDEEYTLQLEDARTGHGFLAAYTGLDGENLCEKLDRSTAYRFRLCAQNDEGASAWSSDVTYRTLPERPSMPGRPAARGKIHSRSFRVRWEPPADDGGAPVSSYTLELDGGEGYQQAYVGAERDAHCDRLEPGTAYRVRVRCETKGGVGDWSAAETVTTEAVCPGPCAAPVLHMRARSHAASLRWQPPDYDGGTPVTSYRLDVTDAADGRLTAYEGAETECTVEDLLPGREYRAHVCASNRIGTGAQSPELLFSTGPAPPDVPSGPTVVARSPFHAFVEWLEPPSNGAPILDYRLEMSAVSAEEAFAQAFGGLRTDCEVKNLTPFTNYFFRVCASNAAGQSDWSEAVATQTPRAPPAAPVGVRVVSTATELTVSWQTPAAHGAEVEHYLVEYGEGVVQTSGSETECTLSGLVPETAYRVRVTAVNELGGGPASAALRAFTRPPPPAPPRLVCSQRGHNYLKLKWGEGKNAEFTQFYLEMEGPKFAEYQCVYRGTAYTCKIKKLQESMTYRFRMYASDDRGGSGAYSEPLALATCAAPPGVPRAFSAAAEMPRAAVLAWSPPEPVADEPFSYLVQCCSTKDQTYKQVYSGTETTCMVDELESGVEYSWRTCAVRGGLQGAWCTPVRLATPAAPLAPATAPVPSVPRARRPRAPAALTDRHTALILLAGFMLVAVLVAAAVEQFINWRT